MAHLSQLFGFTVPKSDDVLRMKCYDEIFAIAPDYHLSPKRDGVPSEGPNRIKHRHNATHADRAEQAICRDRNVDLPVA